MKRVVLFILLTVTAVLADFSRDDSKEIVDDNLTGLSWQDDGSVLTYTADWQGAIDYCEALTLGGYDDWYLPNFNELDTIVDRRRSDPAIKNVFVNTVSDRYWSSTTFAERDMIFAWNINFDSGYGVYNLKYYSYYVRCVRGGQ